jgi:endonuclease-3
VAHATEIERRLRRAYPDAHCELDHRNAFELTVATILSAQCTDKRVNLVTPEFFRRWPDAAALALAPIREIEQVVHSTGFYRNKARSLSGLALELVKSHGGEIPASMDVLVKLPGIGRKTANVILGNAFGMSEGITVDTHVIRLSGRFGLTKATDAVRVERALLPLFPRASWTMLSHLMIFHGRRVCEARRPRCGECPLSDICPSASR